MPFDPSAAARMEELFGGLGVIKVRAMFGGAGVYADGLMFAILADDEIWLKEDADNAAFFDDAALAHFTYEKKDGATARMRYRAAPADLYDDADTARLWAGRALDAARRAAVKKGARKRAG